MVVVTSSAIAFIEDFSKDTLGRSRGFAVIRSVHRFSMQFRKNRLWLNAGLQVMGTRRILATTEMRFFDTEVDPATEIASIAIMDYTSRANPLIKILCYNFGIGAQHSAIC
ncbi:hypothetical protein DMN91_001313 [Ooceraea biroi]|uniref:Uncharacterized protein n=1 Tax=Ooceraea biroi TaxID=2015173 RepID=A0A3L8E659_OOCBI|nr:hypothetical protein DMN91_001313 [Ooceraea biroi]